MCGDPTNNVDDDDDDSFLGVDIDDDGSTAKSLVSHTSKDLYVASFPCTPFSVLNTKVRGAKYDPFREPSASPFISVSRHISARRPKIVITEQVLGILREYRHKIGRRNFIQGEEAKAWFSVHYMAVGQVSWPSA